MKKLLLTALLFAGIANAEEATDTKWTNNKHGQPVVIASSHKDKFIMSQDCNGNAVLTLYDFATYNADTEGKVITYKFRVDKSETYAGQSKVQRVDDFYAIRVWPNEEQLMELMKGNTLRIVYKLGQGGFGGMEVYTLKGYTSAMLKAPNSCADGSDEYFNLDDEVYF